MGFYLLEHPNPHGPHFYTARRGSVLAIVVHITAGLEDLDGVDDQSAEKTARYAATTDRPVSWHSGSDADSSLNLLPPGYTAFHVQGYNSRTYGHEISKTSPDWRASPPDFVTKTLERAAAHLRPIALELGIPFRLASKAELDAEIAKGPAGRPVGFIGHAPLDPGRRRDPGIVGTLDTFPWTRFFALPEGPSDFIDPEEELMALVAKDVRDARAVTVRRLYLEHLLREPSIEDLGRWMKALEEWGVDATTAMIVDSPEGKSVLNRKRISLGLEKLA